MGDKQIFWAQSWEFLALFFSPLRVIWYFLLFCVLDQNLTKN